MPDYYFWLLLLVIALALGFGVVNGFNDAANAIATVVGTRVLSPRKAVLMAVFLNFAGITLPRSVMDSQHKMVPGICFYTGPPINLVLQKT